MAGADERLHPPPGIPAVAGYVYVPTTRLYQPVAGVDQGDGSAAQLVSGAGAAPAATSLKVLGADGTSLAKVTADGDLHVALDSQASGLALDGADITTPTAMPAGGVGIRGWLSAIWTKLNGTVTVDGSAHTQPISGTVTVVDSVALSVTASALPLPTGAAQENTMERRFGTPGTPKSSKGALLNTAGDNDFITPTAGKSIRVLWVYAVPSSDNTAANLVQFKFGTGGTPFYTVYAVGHWEVFEGAVDQHVYLNLGNTQPVAVTVHYEEF